MKIAVVGTGIAGLAAAYLLQHRHDIEVFEQNDYIGGHTHTVVVDDPAGPTGVDTGFIVHNPTNYPHLVRLFRELGVATQDSDMSFSVRCERCNLEYSAQSLGTLFAQRRNLVRLSFYRLIADGLRFLREATAAVDDPAWAGATLGDFLARRRFAHSLVRHLVVPLAAAIWSTAPAAVEQMPAQFCFRFFHNHGMLDRRDSTVWRTVVGGSHTYVRAITARFRDRVHTNRPIVTVRRGPDRVELTDGLGQVHHADAVVIATHADQALRMLADASDEERGVLGAFRYTRNTAVLHTDTSVLPQRRVLHASWNYALADCRSTEHAVSLSYYMNRLQRLETTRHYCVSVNPYRPLDAGAVLRRIEYEHPLYSLDSVRAQRRLAQLNGVRRTWYCGAHFGYGFHEDGLVSALTVAEQLGVSR